MNRIVLNIETNERFIETKEKDWRRRLEKHRNDNRCPEPMPWGHEIFKGYLGSPYVRIDD